MNFGLENYTSSSKIVSLATTLKTEDKELLTSGLQTSKNIELSFENQILSATALFFKKYKPIENCQELKNLETYNSAIINSENAFVAEAIFLDILNSASVYPDASVFTNLFHVYSDDRTVTVDRFELLFRIMSHNFKIAPLKSHYKLIIGFLSRNKLKEKAEHYFKLMVKSGLSPSLNIHRFMLTLYEDSPLQVKKIFNELKRSGVKPNEAIYNLVLNILARNFDCKSAFQVYEEMLHRKCRIAVPNYILLIEAHRYQTERAELLFTAFKSSVLKSSEHDGEDAAKKTRAPTAAYNALLSAYSTAAMHDKCEALYSEMLESGIWPNVSTYALLIASLKEKCDVYKAREYFLDMINRNIKPTMNVYKTLFKIHAEAPENTLANALYDSLIESGDFQQPIDKEILKLLILANSRCGDYAKATAYKNLYDNLQDGGVNNGKGLDEEVIEALMFAASRNIEGEMEMLNYFEKLHEKSAYSYEIIIQYYINKQNLNKAKEYYLRMTIIGFECSWQVRKYFSESTL